MDKKILLIDADSTIPNLALMKVSSYYKKYGYDVDLLKLNIPYYPNRKKQLYILPKKHLYNKVYCSVIFEGNIDYIKGENIIFGGTGYSLDIKLPDYINNHNIVDYSLYPDNDISYGFISRGCIRNCYFCKVPRKEGKIHQVNSVDNIVKHKKVKFLDNNILALPNHKDILLELIQKKIKCQFNQGLDIRLLDDENSFLLSCMNYLGNYVFAFDDWNQKDIVKEKLKITNIWRKDWGFKFFVYCNPDMKISNIVKRIEWLKKHKCLVYIMRDISCWKSKKHKFFVDLAAWANQVNLFKKMSFSDFLNKRHLSKKRKERIFFSNTLYYNNL